MPTFVRTQTISHPVGERGRVIIKLTSGDVRVTASGGSDAAIRASYEIRAASEEEAERLYERVRLRVRQAPGELTVEEPDSAHSLGSVVSRLFSSGGFELDLEASLPAGVQLHVAGVSAEVRVSGMRGDQRYATVSGDLSLADGGGKVKVNAVSGDTILRAVAPVAVEAEGVSGDLVISAPRLDRLRATTVSGDVDVEGELATRGEFGVETVSGDLTFGLLGSGTFDVRGISSDVHSDLDHRIEGTADRRRLIIGSGGPVLVFRSLSGDVVVRGARRVSPHPPVFEPASTTAAPDAASQLEILRALERGEISVDEATRKLAGGI